MTASIEDRASFDFIRYANCWEDARVLCQALRPKPGDRILSIASAGDNVLALLSEGVHVVAADLNAAQLACVELRVAAFRHLSYETLIAFLGIREHRDRNGEYHRLLRPDLSHQARVFWDARLDLIDHGVIHAGKFERYFQIFRTRMLPLVHGKGAVLELLEHREREGREQFYASRWNTWRWRLLFRVFFSRFVMGRLGRDPAFFDFVEGPVSEHILQRTRHALTQLATHDNPYLDYILMGNYVHALPPYLEPGRFEAIRQGLDRLVLHHGTIQEAAAKHGGAGFAGYNLSDIFEYLPEEVCKRVFAALLDSARPGARLVYWNMLVPRQCPFEDRVSRLEEMAGSLFAQDRAFFYRRLVVEEAR